MSTTATAPKKRRRGLVVLIVALALVLALAGAFFIYTGIYYRADPSVWQVAEGYAVRIEQRDGYIAITPEGTAPTTGYVFYPGGKVQAEAYLPYLAQVAEQGYFCALLQMPFRLAVFDMDAAKRPIADHPEITAWAVGGHSLGGVAAAGFAENGGVDGLVLLAAYPTADLSQSGLRVASITATEDRVLNRQSYEQAAEYLPDGTAFVVIGGGNHGQFGLYGPQDGDGAAGITEQAQRKLVSDATAALLAEL